MKKKVLALVLSAAMLAGLLAGCGSSSSTNSTTGSTGNSETAAPAGDGGGGEDTASTGEVVKLKFDPIREAVRDEEGFSALREMAQTM